MKAFAKLTMIAAASMIIFTGCKKGENDPFLSLSSRDKRLCQEWELTASEVTGTEVSGSSSSTSVSTYNGSTMTVISTYTMGSFTMTDTTTYPYTHEIEFAKDGTFEEVINNDGDVETGKGLWSWIYGNESQGLEKKEAVMITYTSDGTYTLTGSSISPDDIFVFDRLSKDEAVVIIDYKSTDEDATTTLTGTMTFQKK